VEVLAGVALGRRLADADGLRPDLVLAQSVGEAAGVERVTLLDLCPWRLVEPEGGSFLVLAVRVNAA
jgi:hypothetical protein